MDSSNHHVCSIQSSPPELGASTYHVVYLAALIEDMGPAMFHQKSIKSLGCIDSHCSLCLNAERVNRLNLLMSRRSSGGKNICQDVNDVPTSPLF